MLNKEDLKMNSLALLMPKKWRGVGVYNDTVAYYKHRPETIPVEGLC